MPVFMLTDIEGSSGKWDRHGQAMSQALARHDAIVTAEVSRYEGSIVKHTGDGFFVLFAGDQALDCALAIQQRLESEDWGEIGELRVRIALGAGEAEQRGDDYFGAGINLIARILAAGWGGQILFTPEVAAQSELPADASLLDLGTHLLRDISQPQSILQLCHPSLPLREFPALRTISSSYSNLPAQTTAFFGRTRELAEVTARLSNSCRLLTVTGPGGTGKTRLAIRIGQELEHSFANGVCFVPLAPLDSPEHLVSHIAESLKLSMYGSSEPRQQLLNFLTEKQMLLIMDNFEHLIEAGSLVSEILQSAAGIKVLATSRRRLNLLGEYVYDLGGLDQPQVDTSADWEESATVQLFLDRARLNHPDFTPGTSDRAVIREICSHLDGLPLGIELAASWIRMLSCEEILAEIKQNIDFLSSSYQDLPERHRSIQAVFESSWKLLPPELGRVLAELSIMRGGFSLNAACQTADADKRKLLSLIDHTLIRQRPDGYLEMLEVIRQYAERKLDAQTRFQVEEKRCLYYSTWLAGLEKPMNSGELTACSARIEKELENCRAAWEWAVANGKYEWLKGYFGSYFVLFQWKGWHQDAIEATKAAIEQIKKQGENATVDIHLQLIIGQALYTNRLSLYKESEELVSEGLELAAKNELKQERAELLLARCMTLQAKGEANKAIEFLNECLTIFKQLNDENGLAKTYRVYAENAIQRSLVTEARLYLNEALLIFKRLNSQIYLIPTLITAGNLEFEAGEYPISKGYYQEAIELARTLDNRFALLHALTNLGNLYFHTGDFESAREVLDESLALASELASSYPKLVALNNLALIYECTGEPERAIETFNQGIALCRKDENIRMLGVFLLNYAINLHKRGDLKTAEEYLRESLEIFTDLQIVSNLIDCTNILAEVEITKGDYNKAQEWLLVSFKNAVENENNIIMLNCLTSLCYLMQITGQRARFEQLSHVVLEHPAAHNDDKLKTQEMLDCYQSTPPDPKIPLSPVWEPCAELIQLTDRIMQLLASKTDSD